MDYSLILIFILSLLPSFFWLWIYSREDRQSPEPRRLILKLFILGIFAAIVSLAVEFAFLYFLKGGPVEDIFVVADDSVKNDVWNDFILFVLAAPFIEEAFKYLAIKKFAYGAKSFNQVIDGVIYAVSVSLGFAMMENFIYFAGFLTQGVYILAGGFIYRTFLSTLLHSLSTGWLGYWIGKAKFSAFKSGTLLATGFVFAVLIHAAFNFFMSYSMVFFAVFALAILFDLMIVRLRSHEAQAVRQWVPAKHILRILKK